MANSNVKLGRVSARYIHTDGVSAAGQTLATTSALPIGAAPVRVTLVTRGQVNSSGANATITITAGGKTISSAIPEAKLDAAGYVYSENCPEGAAIVTTDNTDIGVTIGTSALSGSTADLDIIVEYVLIG